MLKHDVDTIRPGKQAGFTLIELLIVIAIIAILAAIAIPQFIKYKQGAYLDSVRSDVKNTVSAWESYDATNGVYPQYFTYQGPGPMSLTCAAATGTPPVGGTCAPTASGASGGDINISSGNYIQVQPSPEKCTNGYIVQGYSANINSGSIGASGSPVSYDSCTGQYSGF